MKLALVGTSHRFARVEVRERIALGGREAAELARRLAGETGEAVCLSTCNRTEVYVTGEAGEQLAAAALAEVAGA